MNVSEFLELVGEYGSPLENGARVNFYLFRDHSRQVRVGLEARHGEKHRHVPITFPEEFSKEFLEEMLAAARASLEKAMG